MTIVLDQWMLPEKGIVELNVHKSFEIKVTAEEARRSVNRWLMDEVSYMIGAEPPTLVVGERVVWRVPAWIGFPHTGWAGTVGSVDVDVQTGEMDNTTARKVEIERCAEAIAARMPAYQPSLETPVEHLAKHLPPAPRLQITQDGMVVFANPTE